ncbi:DUF1294 domain-containing protein [Oryzobacter sp. R7]|uniref:DUF1294 domain-containing protein n=1 Tax=Oryzobacter faecalis TaxID=3388656 RepID=UPI00398D0CF7
MSRANRPGRPSGPRAPRPPGRPRTAPSSRGSGTTTALGVALVAVGSVAALAAVGRLPLLVLALVVGASLASSGLYRLDKAAAQRADRRIPESTLHLLDLLGGWPGGLVARHAFRHKTRKQPFRTVFWLTAVLSAALVAWLAVAQPALPVVG